jgi:anti-anti-sigma factor
MVHVNTFAASSVSRGRTRWITLAGELDLATAPRLRDELEHAATHTTQAVVLDLSGLKFMDCAALRAVIAFADGVRIRGWRLRCVSPPPRVARIWRLTNTEMNLPVERVR